MSSLENLLYFWTFKEINKISILFCEQKAQRKLSSNKEHGTGSGNKIEHNNTKISD